VLDAALRQPAEDTRLPEAQVEAAVNGARRFLFPFHLAGARLGAGRERLLLVAVGILAGSAALAAVLSGRLVMQDRSLAQATARLAPGNRSLEVAWFGSLGGNWRALDREVTAVLGQQSVRAMLYRESQIRGRLVNLRAANDLSRFVRLRSGRLPRTCVPSHCEVLRLEGRGPVPSTPALRLVQVGRGSLRRSAPFASWIQPVQTAQVARAVRYHTPQPSPVMLADAVDGLSRTAELASFFRSYAWFLPVRPGDVHPWSVGGYARFVEQVRSELGARSSAFEVTGPTDALAQAVATSRVAARRLLLLGGETAALLLAFTVLAAAALRRDIAEARRRLLWAGARRWQVELSTFAETGTVAVAGTAAGWCVGAAIAAAVARQAGSPGWQVIEHSLLTGGGVATAAGMAAAAALLLFLTVRAAPPETGRLALTPLDVAAIAAIVVVAVGYARGSVDTGSLASGSGTGTFVLLVPALVTFAAAVAAARLLSPALRALGRAGRRGPLSLRLAALSLARNPGQATIVATFLVASLGLGLFAVAYRSTLSQGQRDEAAYAVPAPYVADEDFSQLVPVLHAWHGAPATPVLRLSGDVPSGVGLSFLGVPAAALPKTGGWRGDFASAPLSQLARRLEPAAPPVFRSTRLPQGRRFELPVSVRGEDVGVRAWFRSPLGDFQAVALGATHGRRRTVLTGRIPFAHARLTSLQLDLLNSGRLTANGGTGIQPSARGILRLGTPLVDGRAVPAAFAGWLGKGGAERRESGGSDVSLAYSITTVVAATFRPPQPTDGAPLPVLATPAVAAAAGPGRIAVLAIEGEQVPARIVGVVRRFPSIVGDAVIADRQTAATFLDTRSPGLGTTDELWTNALPNPPPTALKLVSRADVLDGLRADPLARGALAVLAATAALALALALVGLLLGVAADRRDERGELFDLEAQGAPPSTLRLHLRLRALLVAVFGLAGGIVTGAILSTLVISLVSVTASAAQPEPPLRLVLDAPLIAAMIVLYGFLAFVLVGAATRLGGRALDRSAEAAA
jgi:hypothetical protein